MPLLPVQGTGQDTKVITINRENQQGLKVQSSRRGALNTRRSFLVWGIPFPLAFTARQQDSFLQLPRDDPGHPMPTGKVSCPEGAPE